MIPSPLTRQRPARLALLALLAGLMWPTGASAQITALPPRPAVGAPKPFTLPQVERFTLDNGLQVTLAPYGLAPKTSVSLVVAAGNLNDGEQTWLADVVGGMLEEGSAGRTAQAIAREAASMGGDLSVSVGMHTTSFSMDVLSEHGPNALALIADVARRPDFPEAELARVKQNLARDLAVSKSQPDSSADAALAAVYYGDEHPYGRMFPTDAGLASYTLADVTGFYQREFSAARARLYVAGRFDADAMRAAVTAHFGDWAAGAPPLVLPASPRPGPRLVLVNRPDAPQTTLRLAFPAPDTGSADDIPMRVMNALLGGAFTSRITTNIREAKGYTYSPGSYFDRSASDVAWVFAADVTTEDTGAALREVFNEIERLQIETPTEVEASGMRSWMAGVFILQNASASGLLGSLSTQDFHGLPNDWLATYVPAVLATPDADLSRLARERLPLEDMTLVLVGDLKAIGPQLGAMPDIMALPRESFAIE